MYKYVQAINQNEIIKTIKPFFSGKKVYLVGGYLRDLLSGLKSCDIDIVTEDFDAEILAKEIADGINGFFIELDKINKIYRVVFPDKINYTDIAQALENDIRTDLKRRDLTINSLCFDINENEFIDVTGSINDIKTGIIKGISEQNFIDDPLRLLRIFRFYSATGFKISDELLKTAKKHKNKISLPAKERINTELMKMFEGKYCADTLIKLDECSLLDEIFPVFKEVKKIPPNSHHHLPLFLHSVETVNQIQKYYENTDDKTKKYLNEKRFGNIKDIAYLKFAGFFHDIGKPACWKIDEETGRHRFIGHDNIGAELALPLLRDLKFSKKQIEFIQNLIKYHIYPSSMISSEGISEKTFLKFYRKTEGFTVDVIILAEADRLSARGPAVTKETIETNINNLQLLLKHYYEIKDELKPLPKLIDGNEICNILNISPGKELGEIIKAIKDTQLSGDLQSKSDAINFIKNLKVR